MSITQYGHNVFGSITQYGENIFNGITQYGEKVFGGSSVTTVVDTSYTSESIEILVQVSISDSGIETCTSDVSVGAHIVDLGYSIDIIEVSDSGLTNAYILIDDSGSIVEVFGSKVQSLVSDLGLSIDAIIIPTNYLHQIFDGAYGNDDTVLTNSYVLINDIGVVEEILGKLSVFLAEWTSGFDSVVTIKPVIVCFNSRFKVTIPRYELKTAGIKINFNGE